MPCGANSALCWRHGADYGDGRHKCVAHVWPSHPPANVIDAFNAFCNETAKCLFASNLVCPDWKLENVTAFQNACGGESTALAPGWQKHSSEAWFYSGKASTPVRPSAVPPTFRVIDVDGVTPPGLKDHYYAATYSCLYTPDNTRSRRTGRYRWTDLQVRVLTMRLKIQTAYAIEMSKVLFRSSIPYSENEMQTLTETGGRKKSRDEIVIMRQDLAALRETLTRRAERTAEYASVVDFIDKVRAIDVAGGGTIDQWSPLMDRSTDEATVAAAETRLDAVLKEWFDTR